LDPKDLKKEDKATLSWELGKKIKLIPAEKECSCPYMGAT